MAFDLKIGDCREVMAAMGSSSVDAIVCDPPYGLEFMGKGWDRGVPGVEFWRPAFRVLRPGGHLLAFGGTRTFHRLTCAIENAGFEIRDCLSWLYGSGFPKSLDVGKAIDRQRDDRDQVYRVTAWIRKAREEAGIGNAAIDEAFGFSGMAGHWTSGASQPAVPTLDQVPRLLQVLGNPEVPGEIAELLVTLNGRKGEPGEAWFRREVLGTRAVPIGYAFAGATYGGDSSLTETNDTAPATDAAKEWDGWGTALKPAWEPIILGRKPLEGTVASNVVEHGTGALNIDGSRIGAETVTTRHTQKAKGTGETSEHSGRWPANVLFDEAAAGMLEGASRFFYTAKAATSERDTNGAVENSHPTVKPIALMGYLVNLVTPPGGVVLDPFAGSGSTGVAALRLGFDFIGIEQSEEYAKIAERRLRGDMPLFSEGAVR